MFPEAEEVILKSHWRVNWRAYLALLVLLVTWGICFSRTIILFFNVKGSIVYPVFEVLFILMSLFFTYRKRNELKHVAFVSSLLGLLCFFIIVCAWIVAGVFLLTHIQKVAVILMVPALVLTAFGPFVTRILAFPILLFILSIPLFDDNFPYRYAVAWVGFGLCYGYLRYKSLIRRILFVIIAGCTPFLIEEFLGGGAWAYWWASGFFLLVLFGIGQLLSEKKKITHPSEDIPPLEQPLRKIISQSGHWAIPSVMAFFLMVSSPFLLDNIRYYYPKEAKPIILVAPPGIKNWSGPFGITDNSWTPQFRNPSSFVQAEYYFQAPFNNIYFYAVYYSSTRGIDHLLDSRNLFYNPEKWRLLKTDEIEIPLSDNFQLKIKEYYLVSGTITRVQWSWYHVLGVPSNDVNVMKLLDKVRLVSKYAEGSGMIVISSAYIEDPVEARKRLGSFLKDMYPSLEGLTRPERLK